MAEKNDSQRDLSELLAMTTDIVASHVAHNAVAVTDVSLLIRQVYMALAGLEFSEKAMERPKAAVSIKKSVTPDYIVCLEDGKKLKMMKRHLRTRYNLSPEEYRERWSLPSDYPMVAPNYAKQRSDLAKKIGLGTKRSKDRR